MCGSPCSSPACTRPSPASPSACSRRPSRCCGPRSRRTTPPRRCATTTSTPTSLHRLRFLVGESVPVVERLQARLHPLSAYVVLPVFALANAGVALDGIGEAITSTVGLGVGLGLVLGKPLGIVLARLPRDQGSGWAGCPRRPRGARSPASAPWPASGSRSRCSSPGCRSATRSSPTTPRSGSCSPPCSPPWSAWRSC
ncbi:Na+/H+ antiporter NhaA [Nocardioides sp. W3-2-3]|nr:Na+/H+ antiporter NhaA [Nocardioides convexus]